REIVERDVREDVAWHALGKRGLVRLRREGARRAVRRDDATLDAGAVVLRAERRPDRRRLPAREERAERPGRRALDGRERLAVDIEVDERVGLETRRRLRVRIRLGQPGAVAGVEEGVQGGLVGRDRLPAVDLG